MIHNPLSLLKVENWYQGLIFMVIVLFFCLFGCQKARESTLNVSNVNYQLSYHDFNLTIGSQDSDLTPPCNMLKCNEFPQVKFFLNSNTINFDEYLDENHESSNLYFDHNKDIFREEYLLSDYLIEYSYLREYTDFLMITPLKYIEIKDIFRKEVVEDINHYERKVTQDEYLDGSQTFDITNIQFDATFLKRVNFELRGERIKTIIAIY
ncbi:hypothetical protein [Fodinibius sediminis]|nr:hypothetical protein [Fodinibius sediminis]